MEMTRERISFTFDPRDMLSLQISFSCVRDAVTCPILEKASGLRYHLRQLFRCIWSLSQYIQPLPFYLDLPVDALALFVICFVSSALISILHLVQILSRFSTRASNSYSSSAGASMSLANHRLVIFLPPILTFPTCLPEHQP